MSFNARDLINPADLGKYGGIFLISVTLAGLGWKLDTALSNQSSMRAEISACRAEVEYVKGQNSNSNKFDKDFGARLLRLENSIYINEMVKNMPKQSAHMGMKNIKNLESMVAAGVISQKEADAIRRKARIKSQSKSLKK